MKKYRAIAISQRDPLSVITKDNELYWTRWFAERRVHRLNKLRMRHDSTYVWVVQRVDKEWPD